MPLLFNAIAAASDNIIIFVIFRFLAGLGGSSGLAVAAGTFSDICDAKDAGRVGVSYILAPFLGPSLGSPIGAYVLQLPDGTTVIGGGLYGSFSASWRRVAVVIPFMKETSKSRILYLRDKKHSDGTLVMSYIADRDDPKGFLEADTHDLV